ncbi:protein phosphatase CheZ [Methylobacterium sp. J-070]|uniref:protein phosphatase CheZ n=1 Tax=Methylobacterium sp. J-070 TaxID=2836650 RepID=UPI001FB8D847|nr:protein phosphatase CheZ [Methylobacterium sp. J-070]MCJ2053469.1 protein phosphatase CheZ [Methylobacterium sp. J-070]
MTLTAERQVDLRLREPQAVISELIEIADYIAHLREEIGALRANEMSRDNIPMAHEELGSVVAATAGATNTIMEAAEAMLSLPDGPGYRDAVEERINTIFEACAFQDITGQRIGKVVESLRLFEQRLARFVGAVKARDAASMDPAERARRARAEDLMLNGPQAVSATPSQDDIDALFG